MNETNTPVFVVAPVRSGSTFLRLMLDSHPNISNPGECDFLFDLIVEDGKQPNVKDYCESLLLNRIFQDKKIKLDNKLNYLELISSFVDQLKCNNSILTMNIHRDFQNIPYIFPDARYIHLLRDPRDVARSCIGMGWVENVYHGVDIWLNAEKSWDKLKKKLRADQYIEIKYEELLKDVEAGLTKICNFLDIEYTEQMMDYAKNSTYQLPDKNLSYQWKNKYNKRELQLVEGKASKIIIERGYELSGNTHIIPGFFGKLYLNIKNKKFRIRYKVNKYGFSLYIKNLLANKLHHESWKKECKKRINTIDVLGLK